MRQLRIGRAPAKDGRLARRRSSGISAMGRSAASSVFLAVLAATIGVVGGAWAQTAPPSPYSPFSELRLGVLDHDIAGPGPERHSPDLSVEALFVKPWTSTDPLWNLLLPRPDVGGTVNFEGKTSEVYGGLVWDYNLTERIFLESGFGGSVNDGRPGRNSAGYIALGSHVLFRESASLGFRLTRNWSIMATIEHMSNAGLAAFNGGLTNLGVRIAYAF
jgi:hypothetical protein